jgi:hypothetical protein
MNIVENNLYDFDELNAIEGDPEKLERIRNSEED